MIPGSKLLYLILLPSFYSVKPDNPLSSVLSSKAIKSASLSKRFLFFGILEIKFCYLYKKLISLSSLFPLYSVSLIPITNIFHHHIYILIILNNSFLYIIYFKYVIFKFDKFLLTIISVHFNLIYLFQNILIYN